MLSFILLIFQVGCNAVIPTKPFGTFITCTPEYEEFGAESDFSQTATDVETVIATVERLKTSFANEFNIAVLLSFEQHALNSKDQFYRVLGDSHMRARRGTDIISDGQNFFGRVGNFFGFASKKNIEDLERQVAILTQNLESADETISTRIGAIKKSFNDGVKILHENLKDSLLKIEKKNDVRWSLSVQLKSLLNHLDDMVEVLLEVRDRADHNFPSRLILDRNKVQSWMDRTSKKYRGRLFPVFDEPESYFSLSMTETKVFNNKIVMRFALPLQQHRELFLKKTETKTFTTLESRTSRIQMTHRELESCHESVKGIVCILRPCRLTDFSNAIRSCMITTTNSGEDLVEVIYNLQYIQSQPAEKIILNCQGGTRKVLDVKEEIIQFTIPEFCEAKNVHLEIQRVYTTRHSDLRPNFDYKSFNLSEASKKHFESDGINDEVRHLVAERKHQEKLNAIAKEGQNNFVEHRSNLEDHKVNTYTMLGVVFSVLLILIGSLGYLIHKKQQKTKPAKDSNTTAGEPENYQLADVATADVTKVVDGTHTNVAEDEVSMQAPACMVDLPPEYDFDTHRQLNSRI